MKQRTAKKIAKRYMFGKKGMPRRFGHIETIEYKAYTDGRPPVYKTVLVPVNGTIVDEIHKIAYKLGWDGCHWDDPLVLSVDTTDLDRWEEGQV